MSYDVNPDILQTSIGKVSKEKLTALIKIRETALEQIRKELVKEGYCEVTTSSLVNIAGSCEDPYLSFRLKLYDKPAYLSQSAQLQLEALVIQLGMKVFTVNNSFRAEDYRDPDKAGRVLSEFTLVEPEGPYEDMEPDKALSDLISSMERVTREVTQTVVNSRPEELEFLGGNLKYLQSVSRSKFKRITYDESLSILSKMGSSIRSGDDLGINEERQILKYFENVPVFVTHHPPSIKFFNIKRSAEGEKCFSVDLLLPKLGETIGGALREENVNKVKHNLVNSKIGSYLRENGIDPNAALGPYISLFRNRVPLRGGFGIGFERFVAFLIGSTDILETVAFRTMQPM